MSEKKLSYEEEVAESIVKALKKGTAPWQKPWKGEELAQNSPKSLITGNEYQGINFINLFLTAQNKGYSDSRWMTYNQGKAMGANVLRGEKATKVKFFVFTKQIDKMDENGKVEKDKNGKNLKVEIRLENPRVVIHSVFNAKQFENLPKLDLKDTPKIPKRDFTPMEIAESIFENSKANITHIEGNRAYYQPSLDQITLPLKEQFSGEMEYYSTALHELGHWTGHEDRLDRDLSGEFATESYAKEELKAEIASLMLCSKLGVDFDPQQHHAYVASWVKILTDKPTEITTASRDAMKITNFVMGLEKEQVIKKENDVEISTDLKEKIAELKNTTKIQPQEAKELIDNFATKQIISPTATSSFTKINIDNKELVLFQRKEGNGELHSAINKNSEWKSDFFDNKDYHPKDARFIDNKNEMISFQKNHLLIELRDNLNQGVYKIDDLNHTIALANNTEIDDVKECIDWMDSQLRNMDKKSEVFSTITSLKKSYENTPHLVKDRNDKVSEAIGSHLNAERTYNKSRNLFTENTYLIVPYKEKEAAKLAGAKWDKEAKSWYAPEGASKENLRNWTTENKEIQNLTKSNVQVTDPSSELKDVLESKGLQIDGMPMLDGKIHRVSMADGKNGNKNGWYVGYQDGRPNALFGDYSKGQTDGKTGEKWKSNSSAFSTGYSPEKAAEIQALNAQRRVERGKQLDIDQNKTASILKQEFDNAKPVDKNNPHPYLSVKGVKAHGELKIDNKGNLLIPLKDKEGKLWAVQRIGRPNAQGKAFKMIGAFRSKEEKEKNIYHPAKKEGNFFIIENTPGDLSQSNAIIITEGYSTGASVHESLNMPVVVAIDSGNLQKVAQELSNKYPDKEILIAGDNDLGNEIAGKPNVGKEKAFLASNTVRGEVVLPTFTTSELNSGASDWNDLAKSRGLSEVKKQLNIGLNKLSQKSNEKKAVKIQEQNKDASKIKKREVARKQSLSLSK